MADETRRNDARRPPRRPDLSLGDRIASALAVRILGGAYPAGTLLPSEEKLRQEFNASRTALRESIRVLERIGLQYARRVTLPGANEEVAFYLAAAPAR